MMTPRAKLGYIAGCATLCWGIAGGAIALWLG